MSFKEVKSYQSIIMINGAELPESGQWDDTYIKV